MQITFKALRDQYLPKGISTLSNVFYGASFLVELPSAAQTTESCVQSYATTIIRSPRSLADTPETGGYDLDIPIKELSILPDESIIHVIPSHGARIGRSPNNHIVMNSHLVSRYHAVLEDDGIRWQIVDMNSSNGTYIDNLRLLSGKPCTINSYRKIVFGNVEMIFIESEDLISLLHESIVHLLKMY